MLNFKNPDIIEISLHQIWRLLESEYITYYPKLVEAFELIIVEKDLMTLTMLEYFLLACNNILKYNYEKEPKGYKKVNDKIDRLLGLFYMSLNNELEFQILKTSIELLPSHTSSKRIVEKLIDLILYLEDDWFEQFKFKLRWLLFNHKYRIAEKYFNFIDNELTIVYRARTSTK